jgi:hypothetical protein
MTNEFYIGQTLIATNPCTLDDHNFADALIIGKTYKIKGLTNKEIVIKSEEFNQHEFPFNEVFNYFRLVAKPKYKGTIEPLRTSKLFWMVVVENGYAPLKKHDSYEEAFEECSRLSKKENKTAYVLKAETQIEQISNVIQLK